jgi:hypothetical protein
MRLPLIVICASALLLNLTASLSAEDYPNPARMPVPKNARPEPAPTSVPQGQNERMFLKYTGAPMNPGELGKTAKPAAIGGPGKF